MTTDIEKKIEAVLYEYDIRPHQTRHVAARILVLFKERERKRMEEMAQQCDIRIMQIAAGSINLPVYYEGWNDALKIVAALLRSTKDEPRMEV